MLPHNEQPKKISKIADDLRANGQLDEQKWQRFIKNRNKYFFKMNIALLIFFYIIVIHHHYNIGSWCAFLFLSFGVWLLIRDTIIYDTQNKFTTFSYGTTTIATITHIEDRYITYVPFRIIGYQFTTAEGDHKKGTTQIPRLKFAKSLLLTIEVGKEMPVIYLKSAPEYNFLRSEDDHKCNLRKQG